MNTWKHIIEKSTVDRVLNKLNPNNICPNYNDIFRAFKLCNYHDLKAVFLGYDPYNQPNRATGILFGNSKDIPDAQLSPSLKIIKEAAIDFEVNHNSIIFDQTLESWATQGILMINSALTTMRGKTGVHLALWRPFIKELLQNIKQTAIIYVLFGEEAKTFKPYINVRYNYILEEKHPAYYARIGQRMPSTVFKEVSRISKSLYGEPIRFYQEGIC